MKPGTVRIIGGAWRGRKISITGPQVRPTPNRVRETLFNWLAPIISGAFCLDLFAGSGALGFEALSRGANWVTFVDYSFLVVQMLKKQVINFQASQKTQVYHKAFTQLTYEQLHIRNRNFDLIFLDPPFGKGLLETSLYWLETERILHSKTWIYMEHEKNVLLPTAWTARWNLWKQQKAGHVYYELWRRSE